jgi:exopolysaccharide production protein ExoQ
VIVVAVYIVVAIVVISLGLAFVLGVMRFTVRYPTRAFQTLFFFLTLASIASVVLAQRTLSVGDYGIAVVLGGDSTDTLVSKLLLLSVVVGSFAMCVAWWIRPSRAPSENVFPTNHSWNVDPLAIAFLVYFVSFAILPIFGGKKFYFHVNLVYPAFVVVAALLWARPAGEDAVRIVKQSLTVIVLASLIAAIVSPSMALQAGYVSLIPGFSSRLWGVASHANGLGAVAASLLVIEMSFPSKSWLWRFICISVSASALVMTQSKTSLAAAFLALVVLFCWRLWHTSSIHPAPKIEAQLLKRAIFFLLLGAAMLVVWFFIGLPGIAGGITDRLDERALGHIGSATGRTAIWQLAIRAGLEAPVFGQGADFWSLETRLRYGLPGAVNAHNLVLHTFSVSGVVGVLGLGTFLFVLLTYALRTRHVTHGGSLALIVMLATRAMFEVAVQPRAILTGEFFALMGVLICMMSANRTLLAQRLAPVDGTIDRRTAELGAVAVRP